MKGFKRISILVLSIVMLLSTCLLVACDNNEQPQTNGGSTYTVTFMVEGQQYGATQSVKKGRLATKPQDPTFSNDEYVFTNWYTDATFADGTIWDFSVNTVTSNVTLYAGYRVVATYVTDVKKANEPVTSKITWSQKAPSSAESYEVIITDKNNVPTTLTGSVSFDSANYKVTFTPNDSVIPMGDIYKVSVKDTTKTAEAVIVDEILLGGKGTQDNPYVIGTAFDFTAVNQANVQANVFFKLFDDITIETVRTKQSSYVFGGTLLGGGRTITLENANTAAIYKTGENAYIYNVNIAGKVSTGSNDSVGSIVDFNAGRIEKVNVTANVESTSGKTGSANIENALNESLVDGEGNRGIAGGLVGTNLQTGVLYNCKITTSSSSTGTVKAAIGGGTIVGLNKGKIERCVSQGCFGAWNSKETGKSTSAYSYSGGIAGINANGGIITECSMEGAGKILAQRLTDVTDASGTNNSALGGIVGYNMQGASVTECYFAGIRVHGDENVGGIAGINAGEISDVYVEGVSKSTDILVYVGGRTNIGGIVGKLMETGSVTNAFVTANVYAYGDGAIAYATAEKANNTVYLSNNLNAASKNDGTLNGASASLTEPIGTGNVKIDVIGGSFDGTTNDYNLADTYLSTINANNNFNYNGTTIKLNYESNAIAEQTIQVDLYVDGAISSTITVGETASTITEPTKQGYKFIGWATSDGGEVEFVPNANVSLYSLIDYTVAGKSALYAVFEEDSSSQNATTLKVSVWTKGGTWVTDDELSNIQAGFNKYLEGKGYDLTALTLTFDVTTTESNKVAELGAIVNTAGDYDIVLGCGNNINSTAGVSIKEKANVSTAIIADGRMVARLTDAELAVELYNYLTDVTLKVSVWTKGGTWVTDDELSNIQAGFNAYLEGKGYDLTGLTLTFDVTTTESNKVADLGAIVNTAGDYDVVLGCGNNINSTAGVSIKEKANVPTDIIAGGRMVARLNNSILAVELYNYLTVTAQA